MNHTVKPSWPAPKHIRAFTTTRLINGISTPPYDAFNLSHTVGDQLDHVKANREQLQHQWHLPHQPNWLMQVHGNRAVPSQSNDMHREADAMYSHKPNQVCAVLTADCLPILLCNQDGTEVAAIHAGWRGLLAGIIDQTINSLKSKPNTLMAWFGPAIGPTHFEVDEAIRLAFITKDPQNSSNFKQISADKWLADIYGLANNNLANHEVCQVYGGELCTVADKERFYSYRRDKNTGRMASLIWIAQD